MYVCIGTMVQYPYILFFVVSVQKTMSIDAWSKVGGLQAAKRAQDIHDTLVRISEATGDEYIAPSTISYNGKKYVYVFI